MPEPIELNAVLQGKKILSVEPGTTPGWMIINFDPQEFTQACEPGDRIFLTVFVGGRKGSEDDNYSSTCALHRKGNDGCGMAHMVRDGRDSEMPMASANKAAGQMHIVGHQPGACNYEFDYDGEIDRCGSSVYVHGLCEAHYKRLTTPSDPIAELEQALKLMRGKEEL